MTRPTPISPDLKAAIKRVLVAHYETDPKRISNPDGLTLGQLMRRELAGFVRKTP